MDKLWNYIRGLFNMVTEMDRVRADVKELQTNDRKRDLSDQEVLASLREIAQRLDYKDQLQVAEGRALKAELEAILLRFERRLPPSDS